MSATPRIVVIRLSGRAYRDLRITTHTCLVARAFGAEKIILDQEQSLEIRKTVQQINHSFGGTFDVEYSPTPLREIKKMKKEGWTIAHLTMYGQPIPEVLPHLWKKNSKVVVVVGADKVPAEVYHLTDYNISSTRQPHSEVGALAVFLHELNQGKEETRAWEGATKVIIPQKKGKRVIHKSSLND